MSIDAQNLLGQLTALPASEQQAIFTVMAERSSTANQAALSPRETEESILPAEEWVQAFTSWASNFNLRNPNVDVSRESIYEDRGL